MGCCGRDPDRMQWWPLRPCMAASKQPRWPQRATMVGDDDAGLKREREKDEEGAFFAQMLLLLRQANLVHARISHSTLLPPTSKYVLHMLHSYRYVILSHATTDSVCPSHIHPNLSMIDPSLPLSGHRRQHHARLNKSSPGHATTTHH